MVWQVKKRYKKPRLLADAGIIRNRAKVAAAIVNAQRFLDVQEEYKTFDRVVSKNTNEL